MSRRHQRTKKVVLEELVKNLTTLITLITLTTSNVDMAAIIKKLTGKNQQLQQQLNSLKNMPQEECGTERR